MQSERVGMVGVANVLAIGVYENEPIGHRTLPRPMIKDPMGRSRRALERNAARGNVGAIRELRELDAKRGQ